MFYRKFIKNSSKHFADIFKKTVIATSVLTTTHTIVEGKYKSYFPLRQESTSVFFTDCEGAPSFNLARTIDKRYINDSVSPIVSPIVSFSYPANNPSEVWIGKINILKWESHFKYRIDSILLTMTPIHGVQPRYLTDTVAGKYLIMLLNFS